MEIKEQRLQELLHEKDNEIESLKRELSLYQDGSEFRYNNQFKDFIQQARDVFWVCDPDLKLLYINDETENIFGFQAKDRIGKLVTDFILPEEHDKVRHLAQQLREMNPTHLKQEPLVVELEAVDKHKKLVWLEVKVNSFYQEGKLLVILALRAI